MSTKKPEGKKNKSGSLARQANLSQSMSSPANQVLQLQRTIGNQAVQRMVRSGALEAKLSIGQPWDVYEQEADQVADAVMRMPEPGVQRQPIEDEEEEELRRQPEEEEEELIQPKPFADQITPLVQRQVEEEEEKQVQTKSVIGQITPLVQKQVEEEEEKQIQTKPVIEQITPLVQRQVEEEEEEQVQTKPVIGQITPLVQKQVEEEEDEQIQTKPVIEQITPLVQRQTEEEEEMLQAKPLAEEITPLVQRQVEPEEEEEEELQAKATSGRISEVNPDLESHILSLKGGGHPLSDNDRTFFEPRFSQDFSQVRVHTDTRTAESARAVNARAFTVGQDVVFGAGQYAPGASEGRRLLAHELTHVVQRGLDSSSNKIQRVVEDDITQMSITKDWAISLNDAELEEQINIVRDQLLTLDPTTPEYTAARQNLRILEAEATLRLVTQPKASSADFIISSNAANIVDIGTHVMYTVEQKSQTVTVGTSYRFSWYLYNDKKAYEDLKIISKICSACNVKVPRVPMEIKGPINSKIWKLIAVYPGVHRIVAIISLKGVSLTELEFKQHVSGINWKDVEILILKRIDNHIKLYPELTTFQNQLNKIAKEIFTKYSNPSDLPPKEKAGLWALSQLDVKEWTKSATSPGRGTKEIGEGYKCNKFIADAFGFGAGLGYGTPKGYPTNEHTRLWGIYKAIYPPVANDLADPTKNINNFPVIAYKDHTAKPPQNIPANKLEFGDVIAFYTPGGIGHTGIYLGDGLYIAAGVTRGGYIEPVSNQEPPLHNHKYTTYRRYTPP